MINAVPTNRESIVWVALDCVRIQDLSTKLSSPSHGTHGYADPQNICMYACLQERGGVIWTVTALRPETRCSGISLHPPAGTAGWYDGIAFSTSTCSEHAIVVPSFLKDTAPSRRLGCCACRQRAPLQLQTAPSAAQHRVPYFSATEGLLYKPTLRG